MAKKKSKCDGKCILTIDKALKKQGVYLDRYVAMNFATKKARIVAPLLRVCRDGDAPKGKKLPTIVGEFCPFCGKAAAHT